MLELFARACQSGRWDESGGSGSRRFRQAAASRARPSATSTCGSAGERIRLSAPAPKVRPIDARVQRPETPIGGHELRRWDPRSGLLARMPGAHIASRDRRCGMAGHDFS